MPNETGRPDDTGDNPAVLPASSGLMDGMGRVHNALRISVTDRCNIRCFYCMPDGPLQFLPRAEVLSFEEIARFASIMARLGIDQIRLTGGEPLVRNGVEELVALLRRIPGIVDLAMTTNGTLLGSAAQPLRAAGLDRLNISLDSLRPEIVRQISRRDALADVLRGIQAAREAGFESIRINAVSIAGITEPDVLPLVRFCRQSELHLRFIEFMPLDADGNWAGNQVLTGAKVRAMIEAELGPLHPDSSADPHQPALDYFFSDGVGRIGFVNSVSEPFCGSCNRLRITAEGQLRNCLFSSDETDIRGLLRRGASDDQIIHAVQACVHSKKPGHGIDDPGFRPPLRAMYQIGG